MSIELMSAEPRHGEALYHLFQFYVYDFSELLRFEVDDMGQFAAPAVVTFFDDPNCFPYLMKVQGRWAGFAIVRWGSRLSFGDDAWDMEEFFVLRRHRRSGVGREAASRIFGRHPGRWEVRQRRENQVGIAFWRATVQHLTEGDFTEETLDDERWRGPVQRFLASV